MELSLFWIITSIVMTKRMENNVNKETVWKATVTLWETKTNVCVSEIEY